MESEEVPLNDQLTKLSEPRRWHQQAYPVPVVAAIIRRAVVEESSYLLIERIHSPYAGKWALVGGRWEFGETLSDAVTREVLEETGLVTSFVAWRAFVSERLFPQTSNDLGAHFVIFVCEVQVGQAEAREQTEGRVAWFTEDQITELHSRQEMVPTDYQIWKHCLTPSMSLMHIEADLLVQDMGSLASIMKRFEPRT